MRIAPILQYYPYNYVCPQKNSNISFEKMNKPTISQTQIDEYNDLRVFNHHIYEYQKGLRNLILTTEKAKYRETIERKLNHYDIPYIIHEVKGDKINVFFGAEACINVVKTFTPKLNKLSAEQDFILGIMLGYDRVKQCERYLKIKNKEIRIGKTEE